jgi:hypothetical protein
MHAPAAGGRLRQQIRIGAEPWLRKRVERNARQARKRVHARPPAVRAPHGREQKRPAPRRRPQPVKRPPRVRPRPARRRRSALRPRSRPPSPPRRKSQPRSAPHQRRKPRRRCQQRQQRRNQWPQRQSQPRPQRLNRHRVPWRSLRWERPRRRDLPPPLAEVECRQAAGCQAQVQARVHSLTGRPGRETTTICSGEGRVGVASALPPRRSAPPPRPPRPSRSMPSSQCSTSSGWSSR